MKKQILGTVLGIALFATGMITLVPNADATKEIDTMGKTCENINSNRCCTYGVGSCGGTAEV